MNKYRIENPNSREVRDYKSRTTDINLKADGVGRLGNGVNDKKRK